MSTQTWIGTLVQDAAGIPWHACTGGNLAPSPMRSRTPVGRLLLLHRRSAFGIGVLAAGYLSIVALMAARIVSGSLRVV